MEKVFLQKVSHSVCDISQFCVLPRGITITTIKYVLYMLTE